MSVQRLPLALLLVLGAVGYAAEDATKAIQTLQAALAGDDAQAKKAALKTLTNKNLGQDDVVVPLLVGAISDRQAGEAAIAAAVSRVGKAPPKDGIPRPGWPQDKVQAAWAAWLAEFQAKQKIKELEKKIAEAEKKKKTETPAGDGKPETKTDAKTEGKPGEKTADPVPVIPPQDLGKADRIIFKNGGSLVCFIQSRRVDGEGKLLSLRVVHLDGGGEETLAADLVSRVEEDIK